MRSFLASEQSCSEDSSQNADFSLLFQNVRDAAATLGFRALAAIAANCHVCLRTDSSANLRAMELSISGELEKAEAVWSRARSVLVRLRTPTSQPGAALVRSAVTVGKPLRAVVVRRTISG